LDTHKKQLNKYNRLLELQLLCLVILKEKESRQAKTYFVKLLA